MANMRGRSVVWTCALYLVLTLGGCSAVSERVAGWYVTRQLDRYLDLTSEQKRTARLHVDETLTTLRSRELPLWIALLRDVREGIRNGLDEDDITLLQQRYDARLDAAVVVLAPSLSRILTPLSPAQLDHFAERMLEDVNERHEERSLPGAERQAVVEERALEALEDFVGDLTGPQEDEVRKILRQLPDERPAQYRSAGEQIASFRAFMATAPSSERLEAELRRMWERRYDGLGAGRDKLSRRKEQRAAILEVYRALDTKQRAHAAEELSDRISTLKRLSAG